MPPEAEPAKLMHCMQPLLRPYHKHRISDLQYSIRVGMGGHIGQPPSPVLCLASQQSQRHVPLMRLLGGQEVCHQLPVGAAHQVCGHGQLLQHGPTRPAIIACNQRHSTAKVRTVYSALLLALVLCIGVSYYLKGW